MTLLDERISEPSPVHEPAASQPSSFVSTIVQANRPSYIKEASKETPTAGPIAFKIPYDANKIQQELQIAALDGFARLQLHKNQQMTEIQQYYDSLIDSSIDQLFIEVQQNICIERSEELWLDVALVDHRMATILKTNEIDVDNYFDLTLRTEANDVKAKIESAPEFKEFAERPDDIRSQVIIEIDAICNLYHSELNELIENMKEIDELFTKRSRNVENISIDLARSLSSMRTDLDSIYAKPFDSHSCTLIGFGVFEQWADRSDFNALATGMYSRILSEMHANVEEGIKKMHLVNFVLMQMNY